VNVPSLLRFGRKLIKIEGINQAWNENSLEGRLGLWDGNREVKRLKALPLIVAWGIWISRDTCLLNDRYIFPIQVAVQSLSIIKYLIFPTIESRKAC
jgi:hypothetical protein